MTRKNTAHAQAVEALVQAGIVNGGIHVHAGSTPSPTPHNLPPDTRRFSGRHAELQRLNALVRAPSGSRLCVLDGPPGIGKTTLAVRWGSVERELFPDGQVYVDLRGFDAARAAVGADAAARLILGALHVPLECVPHEPDAQSALLRSMLDQRRLLLILDNVRDSAQVRPLLPNSRTCFTIVASRHRLDGLDLHHGAERVPVGPLAPDEAVHLLAQRLGTHRVTQEFPAVSRIVAACGGHPLALNIVAARAVDDPANSLNPIVKALENRRETLLNTLRLPDVADMRTIFTLSYDNLTPSVAEGFRSLALHPGTRFDAAAAAVMIGGDLFHARETIHELVRCHFVERTSAGHYAFHALTHAYGLEAARQHDSAERRASVLTALLNHQLHAAGRADRLINSHRRAVPLEPCLHPDLLPVLANRADGLAWFGSEYDNVLAALAVAVDRELHHYTWQLAWTTSNFAYLTARWQDWITTHTAALAAVRHLRDPLVEVRMLQQLARAHCENGDYPRSVELYLAALDHLDQRGDTAGRANAFNGLAAVQLRAGAFREAFETASKALALYEDLDDDAATASTVNLLGQASQAMGELREASRYHRRAEEIYLRTGNLYGLAHVADAMATVESSAGREDAARVHLKQAVKLHHEVGNLYYTVKACRRLRSLLDDTDPVAGLVDAAVAALENNHRAAVAELVDAITRSG
ncbi:tetratricopeptide repeat protein [Actinosynnema sp. NPDC023587]|uniref:ATP-binding protein n=1 Tax=Actinosynnema sp. NPDC023587 TaxID=3154695 RepID=UPI0033F0DF6F